MTRFGVIAGFPAPGNHDYVTPGAAPYFNYFGENASPYGLGYYSFELGAWHIVSLNSHFAEGLGVGANSPQGAEQAQTLLCVPAPS